MRGVLLGVLVPNLLGRGMLELWCMRRGFSLGLRGYGADGRGVVLLLVSELDGMMRAETQRFLHNMAFCLLDPSNTGASKFFPDQLIARCSKCRGNQARNTINSSIRD